jgi:hypothetical protein
MLRTVSETLDKCTFDVDRNYKKISKAKSRNQMHFTPSEDISDE